MAFVGGFGAVEDREAASIGCVMIRCGCGCCEGSCVRAETALA